MLAFWNLFFISVIPPASPNHTHTHRHTHSNTLLLITLHPPPRPVQKTYLNIRLHSKFHQVCQSRLTFIEFSHSSNARQKQYQSEACYWGILITIYQNISSFFSSAEWKCDAVLTHLHIVYVGQVLKKLHSSFKAKLLIKLSLIYFLIILFPHFISVCVFVWKGRETRHRVCAFTYMCVCVCVCVCVHVSIHTPLCSHCVHSSMPMSAEEKKPECGWDS